MRLEYDPGLQRIADHWYSDEEDPEESALASTAREPTFIADRQGHPLRTSALLNDLGADSEGLFLRRMEPSRAGRLPGSIDERDTWYGAGWFMTNSVASRSTWLRL